MGLRAHGGGLMDGPAGLGAVLMGLERSTGATVTSRDHMAGVDVAYTASGRVVGALGGTLAIAGGQVHT